MNFNSLGGRRYLLAWGVLVVTALLQYLGKLDIAGTAYGLTVGATVGAYITGNVVQKLRETGNDQQPKN